MTKQIPILYSTTMVEAVLDDRKNQTRRLKGLEEINQSPDDWQFVGIVQPNYKQKPQSHFRFLEVHTNELVDIPCPYGQPGDILYVRENWKMVGWHFEDSEAVIEYQDGQKVTFETPDGKCDDAWMWIVKQYEKLLDKGIISPQEEDESPVTFTGVKHPFSPSIHLPKWCSRIWLEVTDVRVERLQDINPNDACLEGVEYWNIDHDALEGGELQAEFKNYMWVDDEKHNEYSFPTYANSVDSFRTLWQSINGPESWKANPWVWVVSFKVLSKTGIPESLTCSSKISVKPNIKIAWSISESDTKPFYIDTVRKLIGQYDNEEISLSKLVEELNITAINFLPSLPEFKQLKSWKESATEILNNIDLQECGKLLKLQPGSDISKHILPAIKEIMRLRDGIERIIDPIKYMRDNLKPGERLDKAYAAMLSEDAGYLQQIAQQLLNKQA